MDNTTFLLRGWRESLEIEATLNSAERQEYSRVVENYLLAREQRGWGLGVESAKNYIDLVEEKKLAGVRWEVGRRALRWLMDFMKKGLVMNSEESWQGHVRGGDREDLLYREATFPFAGSVRGGRRRFALFQGHAPHVRTRRDSKRCFRPVEPGFLEVFS